MGFNSFWGRKLLNKQRKAGGRRTQLCYSFRHIRSYALRVRSLGFRFKLAGVGFKGVGLASKAHLGFKSATSGLKLQGFGASGLELRDSGMTNIGSALIPSIRCGEVYYITIVTIRNDKEWYYQ